MKIYTKTGDLGTTSTFSGERMPKTDSRIEAVGSIDELNSLLGVVLSQCHESDHGTIALEIRDYLQQVQHDLFSLGAELSLVSRKDIDNIRGHSPHITDKHIEDIEACIDDIQERLVEQKSFLLPNGTTLSCWLHLSRTVARRAERGLWSLAETYYINKNSLRYLNRLSDMLYVLARYANKEISSEQQPMYKYFK